MNLIKLKNISQSRLSSDKVLFKMYTHLLVDSYLKPYIVNYKSRLLFVKQYNLFMNMLLYRTYYFCNFDITVVGMRTTFYDNNLNNYYYTLFLHQF